MKRASDGLKPSSLARYPWLWFLSFRVPDTIYLRLARNALRKLPKPRHFPPRIELANGIGSARFFHGSLDGQFSDVTRETTLYCIPFFPSEAPLE